jgi:hypothetical protein
MTRDSDELKMVGKRNVLYDSLMYMDARRNLAEFVRRRPWLWEILMPGYSAVRRYMLKARIQRAFGDRMVNSLDEAERLVASAMAHGGPLAIGKVGSLEGEAAGFYFSRRKYGASYPPVLMNQLFLNVGLFPKTDEAIDRFCATLLEMVGYVDMLGVQGYPGEAEVVNNFARRAKVLPQRVLEPWYSETPWSSYFAGKRVTVLSPFADTIAHQFARRDRIWSNPQILPQFELRTVRMPFSPGLRAPEERDWEVRMNRLAREIEAVPYDILVAGAGGISLLLAAHARKTGRVGIHMGGPTQVLFGIRGRRWDNDPFFQGAMNEFWVRPSSDETPTDARSIENGCYW